VGAVVVLGAEQEPSELTAVHGVLLRWLDSWPAHVLGRVRRDAAVDVREPVVAAHRRETSVDRRRGQAALFHGRPVDLDVRPGRCQDHEVLVRGPLKEGAQVLTVGLEGSAAVPGEERRSRQLRLIGRWHCVFVGPQRRRRHDQCCRHREPPQVERLHTTQTDRPLLTTCLLGQQPAIEDTRGPLGSRWVVRSGLEVH
jgi:hypothetical protein